MQSKSIVERKISKICYVVTIPGTIESFFIPQLQYLAQNGFDVTVICSPDKKLQEKLGEEIRFLPVVIPRGLSFIGSIKTIGEIKRILKKERFDFIQYSTPNASLYASIAAKMANCKVRNYHLMGFRYLGASGIGGIILKMIEKITCMLSTSIECVSKSNLEIGVRERIFPRDKAAIVWNGSSGGVDLKRFDYEKRETYRAEIRRKLGIEENEFVYGFVGRITKDKGVNEILTAFSHSDGAKLLMVGPQEGIETLDQSLYHKSMTDGRIIYTGIVTDVEKYYAAIDVLLLPSYREGFGNVIIEAAAMGTPAIVSDIPGPMDAIERNKTAFVVEPRNTIALADAMKKMKEIDYEKMGKLSNIYVKERFDSEVLCHKILERKNFLLDNGR